MSYFSLLGNSLNSAINAVGDFVAPIDDDEYDGGYKQNEKNNAVSAVADTDLNLVDEDLPVEEYDETIEKSPSKFRSNQEEFSSGRDSFEDIDAEKDEIQIGNKQSSDYSIRPLAYAPDFEDELIFLRTKADSLGIELTEKIGQIEKYKVKLSEIETEKMDSVQKLSQTKTSLEDANLRFEQAQKDIEALRMEIGSSRSVNTIDGSDVSNSTSCVRRDDEILDLSDGNTLVKVIDVIFHRFVNSIEGYRLGQSGNLSTDDLHLGPQDGITDVTNNLIFRNSLKNFAECLTGLIRDHHTLSLEHKLISDIVLLKMQTILDSNNTGHSNQNKDVSEDLLSILRRSLTYMENIAQNNEGIQQIQGWEETLNNEKKRSKALESETQELKIRIESLGSIVSQYENELRKEKDTVLELQRRVSETASDNAFIIRENNSELSKVKIEVQRLQKLLSEKTSETPLPDSTELNAAKAQILKLEHEQKQLHQIITQLRQTRKSNREDSDNVIQERDSLKKTIELYSTENVSLKQTLADTNQELEYTLRKLQEITLSYETISSETSRIELDNKQLYARFAEATADVIKSNNACFEAEARFEAIQADLALARLDLSFRETELHNLNIAIEGLDKESTRKIELITAEAERKLSQVIKINESEILIREKQHNEAIEQMKQQLAESKRRETDESLLRRKFELESVSERKRLQTAIESAALQLQNINEDVVDRAVIGNLFVSYFKRGRSRDVLELISRMLHFTDDQKATVGLIMPPRSPGAAIPLGSYLHRHPPAESSFSLTSIFGSILGGPSPVENDQDHKGESLAEMWVNFLLEETESKGAEMANSVVSEPRFDSENIPDGQRNLNTPEPQLIRPPNIQIQDTSSNLYTSAFSLTPESPNLS